MDIDALLAEVIAQAKAIKIPVSDKIAPNIKINTRAKTRFGCCKKTAHGYTVELCERVLQAGETACREIIAHELLHTCYNCLNHGKNWHKYADKMNKAYGYSIKSTHKSEELGVESDYNAKYVLICQSCGAEIKRMKMSRLIKYYRSYRCKCGGELKLIK